MSLPLKRYGELLATYLRPQWRGVLALAALLLGSIGLQLARPQIVRRFIDATQMGAPERTLLLAAALFIAVSAAQQAAALGSLYLGTNVGMAATNALRSDLLRHLLRLDLPFHKRHTPGELIERAGGDVNALANFFSQLVVHVLGNGLLVLGTLALLFTVDAWVGLALTVYALLAFAALVVVQSVAVKRWAAMRGASAALFGYFDERLSGMEDVRANGGEAYVMLRLYALMRVLLMSRRRADVGSNFTFLSTNVLSALGYAAGLGLAAYLYTNRHASVGTAFLVVSYVGMLFTPLENIRHQVQDLQSATASINRIDALLAERPAVLDHPASQRAALPGGPLAVDFDAVSFAYDDGVDVPAEAIAGLAGGVLHDITFSVAPGRVLGVLGRTGSGKTTLTRLLFRLYDPQQGAILLGDADLRHVSLADLRRRVGMVTQDVQLFQASIRDNLTFFDAAISDAQIVSALDELGLRLWLEALPRGLDTLLGAGGRELSAGEAQLLAFARVFLKDPGLVILDEASSRLDPATEHLLTQAVDRLLRGRTGIVIAHRLQTVRRVDDVLVLENGRLLEWGARRALERDPHSHFSRLLRTGLEADDGRERLPADPSDGEPPAREVLA